MGDQLTMPVFKPMRKRRMLLGLGLKEWMRVVGSLVIGAMLALSLGTLRQEADVALNASELQEQYGRYSLYQSTLQTAESMMDAAGTDSIEAIDLTADERSFVANARYLGIDAQMGRDELIELIPKSELRVIPVFPDIPRWMFCLGIPLVITVLLSVEVSHNTTLSREGSRYLGFMSSQRVFDSTPKAYLRGR